MLRFSLGSKLGDACKKGAFSSPLATTPVFFFEANMRERSDAGGDGEGFHMWIPLPS